MGLVTKIKANAIGVPGQRRFQLLVEAQHGTATIWLEKEQLFQLALAIQELLTSLKEASAGETSPQPPAGEGPALDFQAQRLALGYDEEQRQFLLEAYEASSGRSSRPTASFRAGPEQFRALAQEALEVCAAGRPTCALCGRPIDPQGHTCPRSNGHFTL
jgi:uncharacterized repeat protein (TIGR03847 family)